MHKRNVVYHEQRRTVTIYDTDGNRKIYVANIVVCAHLKRGNMRVAPSKGRDHGVLKVKVQLGKLRRKVQRQQVDPYNCRTVSEQLKTTTWKASMSMGRWNCQTIRVNMEKKGEKKDEMEVLMDSDVEKIWQLV